MLGAIVVAIIITLIPLLRRGGEVPSDLPDL
jgi:hypothetical protein